MCTILCHVSNLVKIVLLIVLYCVTSLCHMELVVYHTSLNNKDKKSKCYIVEQCGAGKLVNANTIVFITQ